LPPQGVPIQTQCAVPAGSVDQSWAVNRHTTWCTSPVCIVLQLRMVLGWGLEETEISAGLWALEARERLFYSQLCHHQ